MFYIILYLTLLFQVQTDSKSMDNAEEDQTLHGDG